MPYATKSLAEGLFRPTTSVKGDEAPSVIRGQNVLLRGPQGNQYFEVHIGDKDLSEDFNLATLGPVTGTLATTANSATVSGSGTLFRTELHIGQTILSTTGEVLSVREVLSDTSFVAYNNALATASGLTFYRMPQLSESNRKRVVQLTGNTIELRLGHRVSIGSGLVYINGVSSGLTATSKLQAAIYRAAQDDFVNRVMGYAGIPPQPTVNVVAGGTKGMTADYYHSFLFSYWSGYPEGTDGHSRACDVIKLDGASAAIKMIANGQFEIDFTASLVGLPANAKGFIVWKSQEGKAVKAISGGTVTTTSPNDTLYNNGPWFRAAKVKYASQTFAVADVNTGTDRITLTNHPFETGDIVYLSSGGTAISLTALGSPITATTKAYVIKIDGNTIQIASSRANALNAVPDDITAAGAGTHTIGTLTTANKYYFDCLDEELNEEYDGADFAPPDGEFICKIEERPAIISCYGKRSVASSGGSNPGPLVSLSKFANPDGFPSEWVAGGQHNIIGFIEGVGRVFLMTPASLDFVTSTGLIGQAASGSLDTELPIIWRPYWKSGAANRYSVILDDDTLYGRSGGKFIRSIGNGDENTRKYDFGAVVEDVTRDWNDGFAFAARNPRDGQICFVRSAARKNVNGYWESEIWPFSVWADAWLPKIVLTSTTRDMIVSGVATVDEKFEYLCGGRVSGGTYQVKTYRFGEGVGSGTIPWYIVWQPSHDGEEQMSKRLHSITAHGRLTSPVAQIHGAKPGGSFSFANIENGNGADTSAYFSGNINLGTSTGIQRYLQQQMRISNLANYALRLSGTWDATNANRDRLEEVVLEVSTHGRAR